MIFNLGRLHSTTDVVTNSSTELFIVSGDKEQATLEVFVADKIARALVARGDFDSVADALAEANNKFFVLKVEATPEFKQLFESRTCWECHVTRAAFDEWYAEAEKRAREYEKQWGYYYPPDGPTSPYVFILEDHVGEYFVIGSSDNSIPWLAMDELEYISKQRVHLG